MNDSMPTSAPTVTLSDGSVWRLHRDGADRYWRRREGRGDNLSDWGTAQRDPFVAKGLGFTASDHRKIADVLEGRAAVGDGGHTDTERLDALMAHAGKLVFWIDDKSSATLTPPKGKKFGIGTKTVRDLADGLISGDAALSATPRSTDQPETPE